MLFLFLKRLAASHRFLLGLPLGLLLLSAIVLPPGSQATLQSQGTSPPTTASPKPKKPEFVPGEALVRFKSGKAIEGTTYLEVASEQITPWRSGTLPQAARKQILMRVERFAGSDLVEGLRLARVNSEDTLQAIAALNARADVLYAEPNHILRPDTDPNDPRFADQTLYGLTKISAPEAWNTIRGSSDTAQAFFGNPRVVVGVVDQGIDISHPDLLDNIWTNPTAAGGDIPGITGDIHGYNFRDSNGTVFNGNASESHGTHVAGTIGARGNNNEGVVGVNWQVSLMSLRFMDVGGGTDADAIRAFAYAKQMRELWISSGGTKGANIRVLNNSYGDAAYVQSTSDAINSLSSAGILFVAAAGNSGTDNDVAPHYPSGYVAPNMIAVTGTNQTDLQVYNYGAQSVLIGAPGTGIMSTMPGNTYAIQGGTSMATPHVAGAAALIWAAYPNISLSKVRAALIFNGDLVPSLQGKTLTGRRLNVKKSLDALAENDTTPPGTPTGAQITSQNGRAVNISWTASGDDLGTGQASLYEISFTDQTTGIVSPLMALSPPPAGTVQAQSLKIPYLHTTGTINIRPTDNLGNEGTPANLYVTVDPNVALPYNPSLNPPVALSAGGAALGLTQDDAYRQSYQLPFSFPFYGQLYSTVSISTNGALYFVPRSGNDSGSSVRSLSRYKMIAGLWDDIDLRTSRRADADVYVKKPDATRIIFRWQGVDFDLGTPVNFEIELRADGTVKTRYGSGNANLRPVVGMANGEPDPYVIDALTSETTDKSLTNAQGAVFTPRILRNPIDDTGVFVAQHYFDFLNRAPDDGGFDYWTNEIARCNNDPACIDDRRIGVSGSFFVEQEFQETGYVVYRFYRAAYGTWPGSGTPDDPAATNRANLKYSKFKVDRPLLVGGTGLAQSTIDYADTFVQRPEFLLAYPNTMTNAQFVNALFDTAGLPEPAYAAQRQTEIAAMNGGRSRAEVLLSLIEITDFKTREYNPAWVLMEYFGYLRRDAEKGGYDFWLNVLNNLEPNNYRGMVCSFITSQEYQQRFSPVFTRTNASCSGVH